MALQCVEGVAEVERGFGSEAEDQVEDAEVGDEAERCFPHLPVAGCGLGCGAEVDASEVDGVVACIIAAYQLCVNSEDFADYCVGARVEFGDRYSDYGVLVEQGQKPVDVVFKEWCASVG